MKARYWLKKLDYLPRWAWYLLSFFVAGPFGPVAVYLVFYALNKQARDEAQEDRKRAFDEMFERDAYSARRRRRGGNVYQDADCTVRDESDEAEINERWARTERSAERARAQRAQHAQHVQQTEQAAPEFEEDSGVADVLREGREALRRIRRANDVIADVQLSRTIDSIEGSCGQIFTVLEQRPQLVAQLRTFLRYYLPTTLKLLEARAKLERSANTPKAREMRARIAEAIGVIDKALVRQVEALDEYRFIDLESEIDVLRDMLKADGLVEDEQKDEDPFASVLGRSGAPAKGSGAAAQEMDDPFASVLGRGGVAIKTRGDSLSK